MKAALCSLTLAGFLCFAGGLGDAAAGDVGIAVSIGGGGVVTSEYSSSTSVYVANGTTSLFVGRSGPAWSPYSRIYGGCGAWQPGGGYYTHWPSSTYWPSSNVYYRQEPVVYRQLPQRAMTQNRIHRVDPPVVIDPAKIVLHPENTAGSRMLPIPAATQPADPPKAPVIFR